MTVRTEITRGIDYGTNIILYPQPKEHLLVDFRNQRYKVTVPTVLPIVRQDQWKWDRWDQVGVRRELEVLSNDSVAVSQYRKGEQSSFDTRTYNKLEINRRSLEVILPSSDSELFPQLALVRWKKDWPVVSQLRRGFEEFRRRLWLRLG